MEVHYAPYEEAWTAFDARVARLIEAHDVRRMYELGAGANPLLPPDVVAEYIVVDASSEELAKAPPGYRALVADAASVRLEPADLVVTRMVLEHVRDPRAFHGNVRRMLRPGGLAAHFFPTLWALPFVANRLLPERAAQAVLEGLQPGREREGCHAKFPAHYRWCRGPSDAQRRRFEAVGFEVLEYAGFFGHGYYARVPPLDAGVRLLTRMLLARPVAHATTFAHVTLRAS
jgi:SAM-dependent methyltransferase